MKNIKLYNILPNIILIFIVIYWLKGESGGDIGILFSPIFTTVFLLLCYCFLRIFIKFDLLVSIKQIIFVGILIGLLIFAYFEILYIYHRYTLKWY